ncbi:translation initiation factor IF-2 [Qiania dongpingensis]|uniref:Translation initiation factor IF-2 n=1 Tax=Qiania dongpingensis TaxID=2763669 RepID=A0A7G9G3A5_9FIRM|nr:translation initiation factor IF-2 [Qiania dongpingensis]QNM05287.1 translation initiation factor IF-2 [Qiania dongpingensis]
MAKMRVHELAKEIDKNNKDILDVLQANGVNVQSPLSVIDEAQADMVRRAYSPKPEPQEEPKAETEAAPKKRITAVFRSQNSSQAGRSRTGARPAGPGTRRPGQTGRPAASGQPVRQSTRPVGPKPSIKPAASAASAPQKPEGTGRPAPQTDVQKPQMRAQAVTPASAEGRQTAPASRGENRRPDQQRTARPAGERSFSDNRERRPQGDRPYDANRRPSGDRNGSRPTGDRTGGNRQGQQRPYDPNRRPAGDRNGSRPAGGERSGDRPGQFNRDNRRPGQKPGDNRRSGGFSVPAPQLDSSQKNSGKQKQKQGNRAGNKYDKKQVDDFELKSGKRGGKASVKSLAKVPDQKTEPVVEVVKTIVLPEILTIKELAEKMKLQPSVIVKKLFLQGKVVTINQEIDYDTAEEIAMEFDVLCEKEIKIDVIEELLKDTEDPADSMIPRSPVVCVMGHVDHGKTSLLDAIRETNVIAREAGGITQHIGASVVEISGQKITFLDTPGHEAFTAMRMRGAQATDIAILVVAADDGVMPQTVEAINHAKAAGVEIIVAINKIDKPSANIDRVKQELSEYELVPEDWGGSTIFAPVSAHTKEGIENLLEMILLTAEVKELKANPSRCARGLVIEAELDKGKGPVATILVQKGTLHVGDAIAAGSCYGKVRAMMDDKGRRVKEAGPSTPVEILGLNDVPSAGEIFVAPESEKEARSFAETFISEGREKLLDDTKAKLSLDDLFSQIKAGNVKELGIIIKADVQGSVEAVKQSLVKLSNEEVVVKVIHGGVGAINESDVSLASASNAIIIGFNVRPDATAKSIAEREKVDVRLYKVIYQAIEDVEAAMKGMLDPVFEEQVIGHAVVRQTFKASGVGTIAGGYVMDGKFQRNCSVRISREGEQIFEGPLASLKRFKDDVKEVAKGFECGLVFEGFNDIKEDDMVEAYIMVEVPR